MRMEIALRLDVFESDEIAILDEIHGIVLTRLVGPVFHNPVIVFVFVGVRGDLLLSSADT